ncbi:uncharacterized protein DS421_6g186240 [Arachis hypogaea]|nr:uncharacterized protein DS421_6g186240 [Arachis hypogaea]
MHEQKREKEAAKPSPFLLGVVAAAEEDASERERTWGVMHEGCSDGEGGEQGCLIAND